MYLFLSIYSVHLLTFVSSTGCLFLALTVARLFSRKKVEKRKKMRQAKMRHASALPPRASRPPSVSPTPARAAPLGHRGTEPPVALVPWRGDVETVTDCSFFLFLSYCHPHNFAVFLLTGLQEVGVGGTPVAHPGKCLTIFLRENKKCMGSSAVKETSADPSRPQVAAWSPPPSESPGAWGMCWAVSLGPSGLLGAPPGLVPVHPRATCSPPRLGSTLGRPQDPGWEGAPSDGPCSLSHSML